MRKEIRVFAPATVSNVGCGFDVMGFALDTPGDEIVLRTTQRSGITITKITGDDGKLTLDPEKNTAGVPIIEMCREFGIKCGIEMEIHKKMPFGSGLGSSAASAVGAAFALNHLLVLNLSNKELLMFAQAGEMIASGSEHADNVAPCLYGGFILIRGYKPVDIVTLSSPENLFCTVIHPHIEISTKESRKLLPESIPVNDAIAQWGNCAALVAGLLTGDYELIGRSIEDRFAEPVRGKFIPQYNQIKEAALKSGALGCNISGSGPSVFALSSDIETAKRVGIAMKSQLDIIELASDIYISGINRKGPKIIELI